jgi:Uma2 family endonuclease
MATVDSFSSLPAVVVVPPSGMTLDRFRAWAESEEFPGQGRISFVDGRLIIDMSPERIDLHTKVKGEISFVLTGIVKQERLGEFFPDGAWITNREAGLSNEPDAAFASWETLKSGKLAPASGAPQADLYVELVGAPDWVCEVVSDNSENKDTDLLVHAYHKAGVREYWLIDARRDEIDFQLLVWEKSGYRAVEPRDGWLASPVFGREFQLIRFRNEAGRWEYELRQRALQ